MAGLMGTSVSLIICETDEKKSLTPDLLRKGAFTHAIDPDGYKFGWTGLGDLLDTENFFFSLTDSRFSGFSFRIDERRPSQPVIRLQVAEKIREEIQNGLRPGPTRKKEIREEVFARVLSQTDFAPILIDCLWDDEKGRLYVFTSSERRVERVLNHFKSTFGMEAWPISPEKDMAQNFASIQGAGGIEMEGFFLEAIGSANLASAPQSEEKSSISVQNSVETVTEAVSQGMAIKKMSFLARENGMDNEIKFSLGDDLIVRGLRLSKYDGADGDEGMFLLHAEECAKIGQLIIDLSSEK